MPIFKMVKHSQNISTHDEDVYIAAKQVSQYLLGTYYVQAGKNYQYLDDKNDEWSLVLDHRRLIKKPGFEVMLTDIDDLSFVLKQDWIYMKVKRQKKNYQFLVGFKREKNNEEQTNQ